MPDVILQWSCVTGRDSPGIIAIFVVEATPPFWHLCSQKDSDVRTQQKILKRSMNCGGCAPIHMRGIRFNMVLHSFKKATRRPAAHEYRPADEVIVCAEMGDCGCMSRQKPDSSTAIGVGINLQHLLKNQASSAPEACSFSKPFEAIKNFWFL